MRSFKILTLTILLFSACSAGKRLPANYDNTQVMLHASSIMQHDTIGFNLVTELQKLIYPRLLTGDLPIWENPNKDIQISAERFKVMEQSAKLPFVASQDLFIHEIWQIFKHNYDFATLGFTFTGQSKYGKSITYGYVDIVDIMDLLKSRNIPSNANGAANLTYWDALRSKTYYFNLVQFGKEDFKTDPRRSLQLKGQALESDKVHRNLHHIILTKDIEYKILPPSINSNTENKLFYTQLEQVLNENKQTILNLGENDEYAHLLFIPWKLDNVEVVERWNKHKSIAFQELNHIVIYFEDYSFELDKKLLEELDVTINLRGMEEYLSEKSFDFILQRINDEEILPNRAQQYYNGLLNRNWNKIKPQNDKN